MTPFHARLARIALTALEPYGFVLAGGYAIALHGIGDRPSEDLDLFAIPGDLAAFDTARRTLIEAFGAAGLAVNTVREGPSYGRLRVSDPATDDCSEIDLSVDYRQFPPSRLDLGPVLDLRDAAGNKMGALYGRREARDYVDVFNLAHSGKFTWPELLKLGDEQETSPLDRDMLADALARATLVEDEAFAGYGIDASAARRIRDWFLERALALKSQP